MFNVSTRPNWLSTARNSLKRLFAGLHLDRFFGLLFYLEDHLSGRIDLLEENAIRNPHLQKAIEQEKKVIYGA